MKSKIEEILYKHSERVGLYEGGVITCVDENEFDEITQELVKLFAIPDVRLALSGFWAWYAELSIEELEWYDGKEVETYLATL